MRESLVVFEAIKELLDARSATQAPEDWVSGRYSQGIIIRETAIP